MPQPRHQTQPGRIGRRAATRAYTYGFGRAEDLAGIVIVAVIAAGGAWLGWRWADPVVGLAITILILRITRQAWHEIRRDRVE